MDGMTEGRRKGISMLCLFVMMFCWLAVVAAPMPAPRKSDRPHDQVAQWQRLRNVLACLGGFAALLTLATWPYRPKAAKELA
jgi:hypothetical protein